MAFIAPAQATFMVDDFNTANTYSCRDDLGGSNCPLTTTIDDGNTVWNDSTSPHTGITRTIDADLTAGDGVSIEICSNCQAAHITADAGVTQAVDEYSFVWTGPSVDLSSYTSFMFDWGADLAGATWFADFGNSTGIVVDSPVQSALPATPGPGSLTYIASLDLSSVSVVDFTDITQISLHFNGVGALDGNIDNVRVAGAIPEPTTLALLSLGLVGLGVARRRKA